MILSDLVELAAVAATHGPTLVLSAGRLSDTGLYEYWTASRTRLDAWSATFRADQQRVARQGWRFSTRRWRRLRPTIEEILAGELLARVWGAITSAHDQHYGREEAEPITRSVLSAHQEARQRALELLLQAPRSVHQPAAALNLLRRRCERWNDVLIGYLLTSGDVGHFAFDPRRAEDFAEGLARQRRGGLGAQGWNLMLASLQAAFRGALAGSGANPELNSMIASNVLACFPAELFDATGALRSLWVTRIEQASLDAQGLVGELLAAEQDPPPHRW